MNDLVLQRTEEAFHHGIVVTVPLTAHAAHHRVTVQQFKIAPAGVQNSLVAVMDKPRHRLSLLHGHLAVLIDLYSRLIVGWSMKDRPNQGLVNEALMDKASPHESG